MKVSWVLNGESCTLQCDPSERLLDVLRERRRLTGTKEGCGEGECGACTVYLNGLPVNACLIPVGQVDGARVETIEWLQQDELGAAVQKALVDFGGTQCGICTPGIAMAARALLHIHPNPSRAQVRELLAGNLCRCTGYQLIVDAVMSVIDEQKQASQVA